MRKSLFILSLIVFMILSACSKKPENAARVEIIDGIKYVHNTEIPLHPSKTVTFEEELSIGGEDDAGNIVLFRPLRFLVNQNENIYITDSQDQVIKVFDPDGKYMWTIGAKGEGPGEFERISGMQITHQQELSVFDMSTRRLSFFTVDGKSIDTLSISELRPFKINMNSKRNFIITSVALDLMTNQSISELKIYDDNLSLLQTIATPSPSNIFNPFDSFFIWKLARDDTIVYGYNETYELHVLDSGGEIIKKILKDYNPVKITKEEKQEAEKKYSPPNKIEYPQFRPAYRYFTLDDEGRIFVETYEDVIGEKGFYYNVFDKEGRYFAKLPLKMKPQIWKKKKLYTIEEDEEGYQFVIRYKVTWKY